MANRAVFLDRDGTMAADVSYCRRPDDFELFPTTARAIRLLNEHSYKVIVITNQSGVARGYFTEDTLNRIHQKMRRRLSDEGARIDDIYYCPHHPDHGVYPYKQACECRKPHPGLLKRAHRELDIDLSRSFMIGDKATDIEAGKRAGTRTVFVLSGRGQAEQKKISDRPDHIAPDLGQAVGWVLDQ